MGKSVDTAIEVLKTCGCLVTGGVCFYLLSGGKLPFQTSSSVSLGCSSVVPMQSFQRQNNVMESNDREKKQSQKDTSRISDAACGVGDVSRGNRVEEELRRRLTDNSICGGVVGQLTPECLAKIAEIERKRETNAKANSDF